MHANSRILVLGIEVVCCCLHIKQFRKLILQICKSQVTKGSSAMLLVRYVADEGSARSCHRQRCIWLLSVGEIHGRPFDTPQAGPVLVTALILSTGCLRHAARSAFMSAELRGQVQCQVFEVKHIEEGLRQGCSVPTTLQSATVCDWSVLKAHLIILLVTRIHNYVRLRSHRYSAVSWLFITQLHLQSTVLSEITDPSEL
jgi:hypothetical protein